MDMRRGGFGLFFLLFASLAFGGVTDRVINGAKRQLINPARYDASYQRLAYPGGDVAPDRGACTDVIVRAYRAVGVDLQKLVHEDAAAAPASYPRIQKLDKNIDHRRVPNLRVFFRRHGRSLPIDKDWRAGDIVTWKLPGGLDHIGVLTDHRGGSGNLMVIHNMNVCCEEDVLTAFTITGHYRYPK